MSGGSTSKLSCSVRGGVFRRGKVRFILRSYRARSRVVRGYGSTSTLLIVCERVAPEVVSTLRRYGIVLQCKVNCSMVSMGTTARQKVGIYGDPMRYLSRITARAVTVVLTVRERLIFCGSLMGQKR